MSGFLRARTDIAAGRAGTPPGAAAVAQRPDQGAHRRAVKLGAHELVLSDLWGYPSNGWGRARAALRRPRGLGASSRPTARSQRGPSFTGTSGTSPTTPASGGARASSSFACTGSPSGRSVGARRRGEGRRPEQRRPEPPVVGGPASILPPPRLPGDVPLLAREPLPGPADPSDRRAVAASACRASRRVRRRRSGRDPHQRGDQGHRSIPAWRISATCTTSKPAARTRPPACWTDSQGSLANCSVGTLDGLLTPGRSARAAWWACERCADRVGARVPSRSDHPAIAALAAPGSGRGRGTGAARPSRRRRPAPAAVHRARARRGRRSTPTGG